jgi:hypothetical protein
MTAGGFSSRGWSRVNTTFACETKQDVYSSTASSRSHHQAADTTSTSFEEIEETAE